MIYGNSAEETARSVTAIVSEAFQIRIGLPAASAVADSGSAPIFRDRITDPISGVLIGRWQPFHSGSNFISRVY